MALICMIHSISLPNSLAAGYVLHEDKTKFRDTVSSSKAVCGGVQICKQLLRFLLPSYIAAETSKLRWKRMSYAKTVQEQERKIPNLSWAVINVADEVSRLSNTCWRPEYSNKCRAC